MPERRTCCWPDCDNLAEWEIRDGPGLEDYTESCTKHVGNLLQDKPEHRIYPIEQEVRDAEK